MPPFYAIFAISWFRHASEYVPVPGRQKTYFDNPKGGARDFPWEAYAFIAGLLAHVRGLYRGDKSVDQLL